ncbi:MAG: hypothetical protein ACRYG8_07405, partial [Janthinobacterium lividum]
MSGRHGRRLAHLSGLTGGLLLLAAVGGAAMAQATGDTSGQDVGAASKTGGQVYREICQACHMPNAEGGQGAGAIPAL